MVSQRNCEHVERKQTHEDTESCYNSKCQQKLTYPALYSRGPTECIVSDHLCHCLSCCPAAYCNPLQVRKAKSYSASQHSPPRWSATSHPESPHKVGTAVNKITRKKRKWLSETALQRLWHALATGFATDKRPSELRQNTKPKWLI